MGSRGRFRLIAVILAGVVCAAGSPAAEEKAQPRTFNSTVAFDVFAVTGKNDYRNDYQGVGRTPSERPLTIPPCRWWFVEPLPPVDMGKVRQEVEAQGIQGLRLRDVTDADVEQLKGLTGLQYLDVVGPRVTSAGLDYLKGLTGLRELLVWGTKVTDAGVRKLKKSLPGLEVRR
jgi:hypothetical protein